jgi:hypothetical protein
MKKNRNLLLSTGLTVLTGLFYSNVAAQVPQLGKADVKRYAVEKHR